MDYIKWKRRIEMCGIMLLLFPPALLLAMVDGLVEYRQENVIPVEIKYPLSEVAEDQAVLVQTNWTRGIALDECTSALVVNKAGRWKIIDFTKEDSNEWLGGGRKYYEVYDAVLRDEGIPWQKKRLNLCPLLLERAMNMTDVEFEKQSYDWSYYWDKNKNFAFVQTDSYLIDSSRERQCIYFSTGLLKKFDYSTQYIQCKMKELSYLGYQELQKHK